MEKGLFDQRIAGILVYRRQAIATTIADPEG
jgi:hypothetical protein